MQIRGEIKRILSDRIQVILNERKQEIDVFFTGMNAPFVKRLVPRELVEFSIMIESMELQGTKFGKFWLYDIIHPKPPVPKSRGKGEGDFDWSERAKIKNITKE